MTRKEKIKSHAAGLGGMSLHYSMMNWGTVVHIETIPQSETTVVNNNNSILNVYKSTAENTNGLFTPV